MVPSRWSNASSRGDSSWTPRPSRWRQRPPKHQQLFISQQCASFQKTWLLISPTATTSHLILSTHLQKLTVVQLISTCSVFCGKCQMNPVQSRTLISPPQACDPATIVLLVLMHSTVSQNPQGAMYAANNEANDFITTAQPLNTVWRGNMTEKCHVWYHLCNNHIFAVSP